jgi:hypothetical protein
MQSRHKSYRKNRTAHELYSTVAFGQVHVVSLFSDSSFGLAEEDIKEAINELISDRLFSNRCEGETFVIADLPFR